MAMQKLYAGEKLREYRTSNALTQKDFAGKLGVSVPYFNQMENNRRPLNAAVLAGLARKFGLERGVFDAGDDGQLLAELTRILRDPVFETMMAAKEIRQSVKDAPGLARALIDLHQHYRRADPSHPAAPRGGLWQEVRAFFHDNNHYFDPLDRAAESFSRLKGKHTDIRVAAASKLGNRGITMAFRDMGRLRHFDANRRVLQVSSRAAPSTQRFQMLVEVALQTQAPILDALLDNGNFSEPKNREIARIGLAKYFAGAALLPYGRFQEMAMALRHDVDLLATIFGSSVEQICHRLATLHRPDASGIPFHFLRVDQTGRVSKEHGPLERIGQICAFPAIYQAFETPGWFRQSPAQNEQGDWISFAKEVTKRRGRRGQPVRRSAIALVCDRSHAPDIIYADRLGRQASQPNGNAALMT